MKTGELVAIGIVAVVAVYVATTMMKKRKEPAPAKPAETLKAAIGRKLPWAVGDVSLFDDEDPDYCGKCKQWCDSPFFEGHSTECDMCQSTCPGVRND